jgi:3-deoxy-D-manno-octulosonic-acid transferase
MTFHFYAAAAEWLIPNRSSWKTTPVLKQSEALWFHAASAGELEILFPLIEAADASGVSTCVSIFSTSAESWLSKLPSRVHYRGFSPSEKEWPEALRRFNVRSVITAKYEAWPGLWAAASKLQIPVSIIGAQPRSSLRWAKRILQFFRIPLPRLRFYVLDEQSAIELKSEFADSEVSLSVDPRWLRVFSRSKNAENHPRLVSWKSKHEHAPRPYWVIGSAWPEDLSVLKDAIYRYPGTVWIVPHSLKKEPNPTIYAPHSNCILVNEMGMLAEFYSIADRAWVGGGFGRGIHSTMEPAVYGIPVACGPRNVNQFHEARELQASGQLRVCESSENVQSWLEQSPNRSTHLNGFSIEMKLEKINDLIRSLLK